MTKRDDSPIFQLRASFLTRTMADGTGSGRSTASDMSKLESLTQDDTFLVDVENIEPSEAGMVLRDRRGSNGYHSLPRNIKLTVVNRELEAPKLMSQSAIESTKSPRRFRDFTPNFAKLRESRRHFAKKISSGASKLFGAASKQEGSKMTDRSDRSRLGRFLQEGGPKKSDKETPVQRNVLDQHISTDENLAYAQVGQPMDFRERLSMNLDYKLGGGMKSVGTGAPPGEGYSASSVGNVERYADRTSTRPPTEEEYHRTVISPVKRCHSANATEAARIFKLTEEIRQDEYVEREGEWKGKLERWASSLEEAIRVINREQVLRKRMSAIERDRLELRNQLNSLLSDREEWKRKCAIMEIKLNNVSGPAPQNIEKTTNTNSSGLLLNNSAFPVSRSTSVPRTQSDPTQVLLQRIQNKAFLFGNDKKSNENNGTYQHHQSGIPEVALNWQTALLMKEIRQLEKHVTDLSQKVESTNNPARSLNLKKTEYL